MESDALCPLVCKMTNPFITNCNKRQTALSPIKYTQTEIMHLIVYGMGYLNVGNQTRQDSNITVYDCAIIQNFENSVKVSISDLTNEFGCDRLCVLPRQAMNFDV
jgi:hypothetical protein